MQMFSKCDQISPLTYIRPCSLLLSITCWDDAGRAAWRILFCFMFLWLFLGFKSSLSSFSCFSERCNSVLLRRSRTVLWTTTDYDIFVVNYSWGWPTWRRDDSHVSLWIKSLLHLSGFSVCLRAGHPATAEATPTCVTCLLSRMWPSYYSEKECKCGCKLLQSPTAGFTVWAADCTGTWVKLW